jgi:hypothetical protein
MGLRAQFYYQANGHAVCQRARPGRIIQQAAEKVFAARFPLCGLPRNRERAEGRKPSFKQIGPLQEMRDGEH